MEFLTSEHVTHPEGAMEGRKRSAESRWGWSGAEIIRKPNSAKDQLKSAVDLLPYMASSADQIVERLLAFGGIYHRYLHQDEFGPKRAEQLAALRDVVQKLDLIIAQLARLSDQAREALLNCLAGDDTRRSLTQFGDAVLERLYEATADATQRFSASGDAVAISELKHLCAATEETRKNLLLQDTNTSNEAFLDQIRPSEEPVNDPRTDAFGHIAASIGRIRREFETTCRRLEATKGPAAATSLQWLVWELCDLWTKETELQVTNNALQKGIYLGEPQSPAGRFVQAVVEALQPSKQWFSDHDSETLPVRAQKIVDRWPHYRACIVTMVMRRYVADHPQPGPRPGRPKAKKVTL